MTLTSKILAVVLLSLAFQLTVLPVANAYLDPGTGSFIFQALIGAVLAVGLAVKIFWRKIVAFVTGRGRGDRDA